jgi:Flp pilus assembly protein TadD
MRPDHARIARCLGSVALSAVLALSLGACQTTGSSDTTGSIGATEATPRTPADWRRATEIWGERYRADPSDPQTAIKYAQALRQTDQRAQAAAVLEQATIKHPHNRDLLGAYGRALADTGDYQQALAVLSRAHTPDQPDWRILNVQGAVLDQLGRHDEARRHYQTALKIMPNDPSILSNYGLSYALTKDLKRAETLLRQAVAQPGAEGKVRQNLGLVVALQGRTAEAEQIVGGGLPPDEAKTNVDNLRQLLAQQADWKASQASGQKSAQASSGRRVKR